VSPVYLTLSVLSAVRAWLAPVSHSGEETVLNIKFRELPYSVETGESEMIGIDTIVQASGTASCESSTCEPCLFDSVCSVCCARLVGSCVAFKEAVHEGETAPDAGKDMQVDGEETVLNIKFRELPYSLFDSVCSVCCARLVGSCVAFKEAVPEAWTIVSIVYESVHEGETAPDAGKDMQVDGEETVLNIKFRELCLFCLLCALGWLLCRIQGSRARSLDNSIDTNHL
jgi:hypothetical protein